MKTPNKLFLWLFITAAFSCKRELKITQEPAAPDTKPNIILILADDIGYEVPTYTGGQTYQTPNIDFIAHNGIQFCEARSTPLCNPSRVEFLTGNYNFRNYVDWGKLNANGYTIGNLMKSAGYATCISGKWQLGGGDISIRNSGFDNYIVWDPFDPGSGLGRGYHYKNPTLYSNAEMHTYTNNEYGEDILREYLFDFIDSTSIAARNFFCLWTPNLIHEPFQPTPDDPDYLIPLPGPRTSNYKNIPSMVKYLDKEIGMLLTHLDSLGISENTYVIFTTDNGTPQGIISNWRDQRISGGKNTTNYSWGTHVPFIVYKKNNSIVKVDSSIIDFSDIMATLSDIVNKPLPAGQVFDGISFWPQIKGLTNYSARTWSFTEFHPQPVTSPSYWARWIEDKQYKLYDSSDDPNKKNQMFFTLSDTTEMHPIVTFSPYLSTKKANFLEILSSMKN
ncbi:sulfatase-like hydrolase/transferase [Panacibacter ginsenosidivorans]|uniref:Sulfatase-like hydrolase/transferase n=1 Tax=Panacibacter ginsenosidivorans TaxID=1813871 RepID=A0A5B8V5N8_9BACT|nr:sulfatase-like hydrolase/transferase [Panacibacter ginsenosidivorans]QEC66519.1 sulfatase-like hydrolase/transferase [Panacibacter ginsenosidivorans]